METIVFLTFLASGLLILAQYFDKPDELDHNGNPVKRGRKKQTRY